VRTPEDIAAAHPEAVEIVRGAPGGPVFCCEHASRRVPPPLARAPGDDAWLATHWGWDIGAAALTRALVERLGGLAVLSRFSRLVCDANRLPGHPTWIRRAVEGHPLGFNRALDDAERARRLAALHRPYHRALAAALRGAEGPLISVHSFTPRLGDEVRAMEVGVLFDTFDAQAAALARGLAAAGWRSALNAPYSGLNGLIHAASSQGQAAGVVYVELELRQDLLGDAGAVGRAAARLAPPLAAFVAGARPLTPT